MTPQSNLLARLLSCIREKRLKSEVLNRYWMYKKQAVNHPLWSFLSQSLERRKFLAALAERPMARHWKALADAPLALYDAGGVQMGSRLYVLGGFVNPNRVNSSIKIFNMANGRWEASVPFPPGAAETHAGVCAVDSRWIYVVSGQVGTQCKPAVSSGFSFDTVSKTWSSLPPLPEPRYAGSLQWLDGRLHFVGGAKMDRYTPACEHWSLAVEDGAAKEPAWRQEKEVPVPGMHRGSMVIGDCLYLFGGQQGDFIPIPGDPCHTCTGKTLEVYLADTLRYHSGSGEWKRLADMLIPASHTDFSVIFSGGLVHIVGGQVFKEARTGRLRLTDAIQTYDPENDRWHCSGVAPYRIKFPCTAVFNHRFVMTTGQRDSGPTSDFSGSIVNQTWALETKHLVRHPMDSGDQPPLASVKGKNVVMITHYLGLSGAPLILLELASAMIRSGAIVRLFTLADDAHADNPAERCLVPVLPLETSFDWAREADLVIANTCIAADWMNTFAGRHPGMAGKVVWWIHENLEDYLRLAAKANPPCGALVWDSHAMVGEWKKIVGTPTVPAHVVHPGNRSDLIAASSSDLLPFPPDPQGPRLDRSGLRRKLGVGSHECLLCSIGTFENRKGQRLLWKTIGHMLEKNPDLPVKLLLVGFHDEQQIQRMLSETTKAEKHCVNHGRLLFPRAREISGFYRASDIFVLNSQGPGEPFGRATIEAMAFGLPVLATQAGGSTEIVSDGITGFFHPPGQSGQKDLAEKIVKLVQDAGLRASLGSAGRLRAAELFGEKNFLSGFETVLQSVLRGSTGKSRSSERP